MTRTLATLAVLTAAVTAVAGPRDDLVRLAPADAAFVVVAHDLPAHAARLAASPFSKAFAASPLGKKLAASPEWATLQALPRQVAEGVGLTPEQLRDGIGGDALVLAYTPGSPGREEAEEEGTLLVWVRDPAKLTTILDRIDRWQTASGELRRVEPHQHAGATYQRRVKQRPDDADEFTALRGNVFAFCTRERGIRRVLDAIAAPADGPLAASLRTLSATEQPVVAWLNPRAFDPHVKAKRAAATGDEATFLATFERYWLALDGIAVTVGLDRDLTLGFAVSARPDALPAPARQFLATAAAPCALWTHFPPDALATVAARVEPATLVTALGEFLSPAARGQVKDGFDRNVAATLGPDAWAQVFERVGPEVGACVQKPPAGRGWVPAATAAVRFRPDPAEPGQERRLMAAVNFLSMALVLGYNGQHPDPIRLRSVQQGDVEVRFIAGEQVFPPGLLPAYAWKGGYLVVGTTPDEIAAFAPRAVPPSPDGDVPVARADLTAVAAYLRTGGVPTTVPPEQVTRLAELCELGGRLELSHRPGPGAATVTLRLTPAAPLRP